MNPERRAEYLNIATTQLGAIRREAAQKAAARTAAIAAQNRDSAIDQIPYDVHTELTNGDGNGQERRVLTTIEIIQGCIPSKVVQPGAEIELGIFEDGVCTEVTRKIVVTNPPLRAIPGIPDLASVKAPMIKRTLGMRAGNTRNYTDLNGSQMEVKVLNVE